MIYEIKMKSHGGVVIATKERPSLQCGVIHYGTVGRINAADVDSIRRADNDWQAVLDFFA